MTQVLKDSNYRSIAFNCMECDGVLEHVSQHPQPYGTWRCSETGALYSYGSGGWNLLRLEAHREQRTTGHRASQQDQARAAEPR